MVYPFDQLGLSDINTDIKNFKGYQVIRLSTSDMENKMDMNT